jgi:hypothetical protein
MAPKTRETARITTASRRKWVRSQYEVPAVISHRHFQQVRLRLLQPKMVGKA